MKFTRQKVVKFTDPIYGFEYTFLLGYNNGAFEKVLRQKFNELEPEVTQGLTIYSKEEWKKGNKEFTIIILKGSDPGVLVHESIHAAICVFEFIGQDIKDISSEPFCYYVDFLYSKVIEGYKKGK